jgi:hypothetical protein
MDAWRHADYHFGLAVGLEPAREVRLFGMGDWLVDRQADRWADAVALLFADLSHQLRREFVAVAGTVVLGVVPFVVAYRRFEAGNLSVGDFSASIVSLGLVFGVLRGWRCSRPSSAGPRCSRPPCSIWSTSRSATPACMSRAAAQHPRRQWESASTACASPMCQPSRNSLTLPSRNSLARREECLLDGVSFLSGAGV